MSRKILLAILAISLGIAGATGYYGKQMWPASGPTIPVPTASQPIPPYVVITSEMLALREMPESLSREPVYLKPSEVVGRIATVPMPAGALFYHDFAVPVESFRLTPDTTLEVVSFPARPEKAVGGQLRPGQRINVYRVAIGSQSMSLSPEQALSSKGAEAQLLASAVLVVDARNGQGDLPTGAVPGQDARARSAPPTIISVAVPPEVAQNIIALVGETRGPYDLWVTLAPLSGEMPPGVASRTEGGSRHEQ